MCSTDHRLKKNRDVHLGNGSIDIGRKIIEEMDDKNPNLVYVYRKKNKKQEQKAQKKLETSKSMNEIERNQI